MVVLFFRHRPGQLIPFNLVTNHRCTAQQRHHQLSEGLLIIGFFIQIQPVNLRHIAQPCISIQSKFFPRPDVKQTLGLGSDAAGEELGFVAAVDLSALLGLQVFGREVTLAANDT